MISQEFDSAISDLPAKLDLLLAVKPQKIVEGLCGEEKGGIYLFTQEGRHLYVGRTKRKISTRVRDHIAANRGDSPFAFRLARLKTGYTQATYGGDGTRDWLLQQDCFKAAYNGAKDEIRQMDVRWISEPDPLKQTLLEIYVAITLKTPFNDFDVH